jgi:prolyl oligopeptidase
VFLDPNSLSEEGVASLGTTAWSRDGNSFAYAIKMGGSDWSTIHIRDAILKKDLLKDELKWVKFSSIAWTHDNAGFFYSRFDAPDVDNLDQAAQNTQKLQFQKVYYHFVGTYQS